MFGGLAQRKAQASAAELIDPLFALARAQAVEHFNLRGNFLCHALEQRGTSEALALADEEGEADGEHDHDADEQDQHQPSKQAAEPGQLHELFRARSGATVLRSALTSTAST